MTETPSLDISSFIFHGLMQPHVILSICLFRTIFVAVAAATAVAVVAEAAVAVVVEAAVIAAPVLA